MMSMVIARHTAQHFPFLGNMHTIIYGIESKAELRNSFPGQKRKKKKKVHGLHVSVFQSHL